MPLFTVHYHELALKGGNRRRFERVLLANLKRALQPLARVKLHSLQGRILADFAGDADAGMARALRVSGVAHVVPVERCGWDLAQAGALACRLVEERRPETFRVTTRRADKTFPQNSLEVDRAIGGQVHEKTGVPVRLRGAELELLVMVLPGEILVGCDKRPGPGGLPAGTGGRVAVLLSGGIDSPVAAWRMIRRGCFADLIHFHSHPLVDRTTQDKAKDLAQVLTDWQFRTRLFLAPLAEVQTQVRLECPASLRVILYRRFMVRIAERLARGRGCGALVTGESLGQVASQTLENLGTVDAVATMPVLRPLVGSDKQEIVTEAERIGTWAISVEPDQDCCQLFVPPRPATKATPEKAAAAEEALDVDGLVARAVEATEVVDFGEDGA